MDISGALKKKAVWWIIGSLGFTGIGLILLVLLLAVVLLGALIGTSDSTMDGIPVTNHPAFDIPAPLLPIYLHAENEKVSWARLAAIHQVTTGFGAEKAKLPDAIGSLGFPYSMWDMYQVDGDDDGKLDPDDPYDAIFSLAYYLRSNAPETDAALEAWFLSPDDVALVHVKETEYAAMLLMAQNWLWPVIGYTNISSPYGIRMDPLTGEPGAFHDGIDLPAPRDTPVVATQDGTVIQVSKGSTGYGNLIRLQHVGGIQSFYGHLSVIGVQRGQRVLRGESIGLVGTTGKSTGPHLHFGAAQNGQSVDPSLFWLDPVYAGKTDEKPSDS